MLTLPPPLNSPAVLVTVLRSRRTAQCHIFAPQLWALLPTLPIACVVAGDTAFTILDNPSSHDLLAAVFTFCTSDALPPPPASVVDSIINPTSVGNRISAVQTVLSSEYAQTRVTLSSGQLEAILRIPLTPSPSMPVVDVIT